MKLYSVVGSPNCRKIHAVIDHLGLQVETVYLDFLAGDLARPAFAAVNPNRMVPALVDGDFALWESNAIMQYLADAAPANRLFPRDTRVRADIARWQCWELAHFNKAFGTLAFELIAKPGFLNMEPDREAVRIAHRDLERYAPVLDAHMRGRRYAVGEHVTLADYSLAHLEKFQEAVPFDWSRFPGIGAYYERMRADPHWAGTAPPSAAEIGRRPKAA